MLPVLLLPAPILASQGEIRVCKIWRQGILPIKECTLQKLNTQQTTPTDTGRKFCTRRWRALGLMSNIKCIAQKSSFNNGV